MKASTSKLLSYTIAVSIIQVLNGFGTGVSARPNSELTNENSVVNGQQYKSQTYSTFETSDEPKNTLCATKNLFQTVRSEGDKRGAGALNRVSDTVRLASDTIGSAGQFVQNQSKNVQAIATDGIEAVSELGDSSTRVIRNVIKNGKEICQTQTHILDDTVDNSSRFVNNLSKAGGTAINTPISMAGDGVGIINRSASATFQNA